MRCRCITTSASAAFRHGTAATELDMLECMIGVLGSVSGASVTDWLACPNMHDHISIYSEDSMEPKIDIATSCVRAPRAASRDPQRLDRRIRQLVKFGLVGAPVFN